MAEQNTDKKSRAMQLRERLTAKHPDDDLDDDEVRAGIISDDMDGYERQLGEYEGREKKLTDMFDAHPSTATFFTSVANGSDPLIALIENYGDEFREALEDPSSREKLAEANKKYLERASKEKDLEKEYDANLAASIKVIDQLQSSEGLSDDKVDDVVNWLVSMSRDVMMGKFTKEMLSMAMKAINHDTDVASAAHAAEVKGRNAKIDEKLRKADESDGLPQLGGAPQGQSTRKPKSIFDLASQA